MEKARALSATHGYPAFECLQERFTYFRLTPRTLDRFHIELTDDVMDYAVAEGITLLAYSPLLQGYYSNLERPVPPLYAGDHNLGRLAALRAVAEELGGVTLNQLVLAWMRRQPAPIIPLISGDDPAQVEENIRCLDIHLSDDQLKRLNEA